jgi:anti-sigma regulatory factor (Ser/Thr protein kinase)
VLLRQELADGVEVLSVRGPVADADAQPLLDAVHRALAHEPRAVVLDLQDAGELSDGVRSALGSLPPLPSGWPLASLVVRPPTHSPDMSGWLRASDRDEAFAHVERRAVPRTRIDVEHSQYGPSQARAAVTACAQELGLQEVCDDVVLLVSEMVTNAIRYAAPPVRLEIQAGEQDVVVAVCDGSPEPPKPRSAGDDAEGGRGMLLVDMLTTDHGVRTDPPGKAVWARLRRTCDS